MLFNSIHFLIFFPIVVGIYFLLSHKYRWILLLIASYYFYMSWKPEYIILIIFSTLVDYFSALEIYKTNSKVRKKIFLYLSLFVNLGVLFAFKYFNFFSESFSALLKTFSFQFDPLMLKVILPVGISFYTFQTMSYTIDVYRGKIKPEKHLGIFAVFVSFFPQLVAGPIERAGNLLPQFYKKVYFNYESVTSGLRLILWGLFKKIVVADRLAIVVNQIYNNVYDYTGIPLILATFFFSIQIYCDFSGYSDIAIGAARVLGIKLTKNFNLPYYSKSIAEFWRRWHISLSTWFQEYVFTPLYVEVSKIKFIRKCKYINRHVLSFSISIILGEALLGLWHGANWTFVIWGVYHGFLIALYYIFRKKWKKLPSFIQIFLTFFLVSFGYILFRANTLPEAFYVFTHMFVGVSLDFSGVYFGGIGGWTGLKISILSILFLEFVHFFHMNNYINRLLNHRYRILNFSIYLVIIYSILLFGVYEAKDFIYFQF